MGKFPGMVSPTGLPTRLALAGVWELEFSECSDHSLMGKGGLLHPGGTTTWCMLNTSFPSGSVEFWYMLGRGFFRDQPPVKLWALSL